MNVGTFLSKSAKTHAHKLALAYGELRETYAELNGRVNGLAHALGALGVARQDRVAIIQHNGPQLVESLFACFKGGYAAVPINAKLHPDELAYILQHSQSSAAIFGEEFKDAVRRIKGDAPTLRHLICLSNPDEGMLDYETLIADSPQREPEGDAGPEDLAWLFYTSGTTGKPKGAMLTHRNLTAMAMNFLADVYPASAEDVALHAAPLTHGSGLYLLPLLARGATNLILKSRRFDPALLLETAERERVTVLPFLTPTMVKMLLLSPHIDRRNLESLRCLVYGGSPMYLADLREAIARFGPILVQIYGQGEAPMTISYLRREEHTLEGPEERLRRLSSAGIARTDVEVKVFDEADRELPPGRVGEIVVRGDVVMRGYWRDPEATAEALRGGWLHTGDLGYLDEAGYLYLLDRKKDLIISGGANIYPREVEDVLLRHPAVQEAAVVGVPDPVWGEAVKALVVLRRGAAATERELIEFCRQHLASYKKPRSVEFVDQLPKSGYGKVLRRELRERYWAGRERKV